MQTNSNHESAITLGNKKINFLQQLNKKNKYTYDQIQTVAISLAEAFNEAEEVIIEKEGEIQAYEELLEQAKDAVFKRDQIIDDYRSKEEGYIKKIEETQAQEVSDLLVDKINNTQLTVIGNDKYNQNKAKIMERAKQRKLEYFARREDLRRLFNKDI